MMKKLNKKSVLIVSVLIILCLGIWTLWGNTTLEVNEYEIVSDRIPEAFSGFRIAQISDLHNAEFGEGNEKLIELLSQTDPDMIVITGDLIDSRHTDIEIALEFARQAIKLAPVYYVSGNHEARVHEYEDLKMGLAKAGVIVLEDQKVHIKRDGESIYILGIDDPSFQEDYLFGDAVSVTSSALPEIQNESDRYTVLLAHRPELFETYVDAGVDLVFSGHAHGGQFRLPFVGGLSIMLKENIKAIRKAKGLSQEELAVKINVVRQTISKWEQGLSVPDSELLLSLSEVLETPVSTLLGETVVVPQTDNLKAISEKLETINLQLAQRTAARRKVLHWGFILVCALIAAVFSVLISLGSPYLCWDYSNPETAVAGVAFHAFEWIFVRISPLIFVGAFAGAILTRSKT